MEGGWCFLVLRRGLKEVEHSRYCCSLHVPEAYFSVPFSSAVAASGQSALKSSHPFCAFPQLRTLHCAAVSTPPTVLLARKRKRIHS